MGIVGSTRPSRIVARVYEFNKGGINLDLLSRLVYLFKKGRKSEKEKDKKNAEKRVKAGGGREREETHDVWKRCSRHSTLRLVPFCFFSRVQCHLFL